MSEYERRVAEIVAIVLALALGCDGAPSEATAVAPAGDGKRDEPAVPPSAPAIESPAAPSDAKAEKIANKLSLIEGVTKPELESALVSAGFELRETNPPQSVAMDDAVVVNDFSTSFYEKEDGNTGAMVNFAWNERGVDGVEITVQARGLHDVPRNVLHAAFSKLIKELPAGLFAKALKGRDFPRVLGKLSNGPMRQALKVVGGVEYLYTEVPGDITLTINSEE